MFSPDSYVCVPGEACREVDLPPGYGRYSSYNACAVDCILPEETSGSLFNFACEENTCNFVEESPSSMSAGLFTSFDQCNSIPCHDNNAFAFACSPGIGCHLVHEAPNAAKGLYSNMAACDLSCSLPSPPLGVFSFGCSPGLGCHLVKEAPSAQKGLFANIESCESTCQTPVTQFSFGCSPGIGCYETNEAPNAAKGLYSNMAACQATCPLPPAPSPAPLGLISFGCSPGIGCYETKEAPNAAKGLYSNMAACQTTCPLPPVPSPPKPPTPLGLISFGCSPGIGCYETKEAPNAAKGLYSNMAACQTTCPLPPVPSPPKPPVPSPPKPPAPSPPKPPAPSPTPLGQFSFGCNPRSMGPTGCFKTSEAPNVAKGLYSNLEACQVACAAKKPTPLESCEANSDSCGTNQHCEAQFNTITSLVPMSERVSTSGPIGGAPIQGDFQLIDSTGLGKGCAGKFMVNDDNTLKFDVKTSGSGYVSGNPSIYSVKFENYDDSMTILRASDILIDGTSSNGQCVLSKT